MTDANSPFFSIIIPVYNAATWLPDSIGSVLAQTYTDWELICINDGSVDNSKAILDSFTETDKRIKVLHRENRGVSMARNTGIEIASGQYILFLDADDYFEYDTLQLVKKTIDKANPDMVLISVRDVEPTCHFCTQSAVQNLKIEDNLPLQDQLSRTTWYTTDKVYKTDIIRGNNLNFDPLLTMAEDFHYWYRSAMLSNKITTIDNVLYNHRKTPNSLSGRFINRWQSCPLEEIHANMNFFSELADLCNNVASDQNRRIYRRELLMRAISFHLLNIRKIIHLKGERRREAFKMYRFPISKLTKDLTFTDILKALKKTIGIVYNQIKQSVIWRLRK